MRKTLRYIGALALALASGSAVHAETYLCIDGIPGDATADAYIDCIDVVGFAEQLSVEQPPPSGGVPVRDFGPIRIVKYIDRATPLLIIAAATGEVRGDATLSFVRECNGSPVTYYEVRLRNNVVVTSVSATAGQDIPTEQVSLSFDRIQWAYTPINDECEQDAEITREWDLVTNTQP